MKKHLLALMTAIASTACFANAQEVTYVVDPANESQLTELTSFTITFDTEVGEDWPEAVEVLRNGEFASYLTIDIADNNQTVTYTLTNAQTQDGTYTFNNLDWAVYALNDELIMPYIDLTYYIGEPQELEPIVRTNPEDGSSLKSLHEVLISFQNVKTIELNPEKSVVMTDGTNTYPFCLEDLSSPGNICVLAVPVDENLSITECGTYQLIIEDGAIILNGKDYGYTFTYTISESLKLVSSTPAEGPVSPSELENITLTFNKPIISITGYMLQGLQLRLLGEDDMPVSVVGDYSAVINAENPKEVFLTANDGLDITESGVYSLNLPPTLFVADGEKNLAQVLDFVVELSSIKTLISDNEAVNVYTIGGVAVIENGTKESLNNLKRGLYIINGKTTLVK